MIEYGIGGDILSHFRVARAVLITVSKDAQGWKKFVWVLYLLVMECPS